MWADCGILNISQPYRPPWPLTRILSTYFHISYINKLTINSGNVNLGFNATEGKIKSGCPNKSDLILINLIYDISFIATHDRLRSSCFNNWFAGKWIVSAMIDHSLIYITSVLEITDEIHNHINLSWTDIAKRSGFNLISNLGIRVCPAFISQWNMKVK
jgi:hypothetical protein